MRIIVPALITDDHSVTLLDRTIAAIPSSSDVELFLVTQGIRPSLPKYTHLRDLHWLHSDTPLRKWGAIHAAASTVPNDTDPIALLDADDSVGHASLQAVFTHCTQNAVTFLIGDRNRIALGAIDQLSPNSRLFLELFANALLLLVLNEVRVDRTHYPDIQSGFYVVRSDLLRSLNFAEIQDYGGELFLYHELVKKGLRPTSFPLVAVERTRSSYSLRTIADNTLNLPFFRAVPKETLQNAKRMAPVLYGRYFDDVSPETFTSEIDTLLHLSGRARDIGEPQ